MAFSVETLSRVVVDSGLVSAEDLQALLARLPSEQQSQDAESLVRLLVREGMLTAYQAEEVCAGRGDHLIRGNYLVLDRLGQGGMGLVLKAQHRRMKRVVALKTLSPQVTQSPEALRRFQREVEAAAKLTHPNVVTAYDADEAGGTHFLVLEYVDGTDLGAWVRERGPLAVDHALDGILQAARGLKYAHSRGVVHRDIKPSNLLVDASGTVKVLDMGLARLDAAGPKQDDLTGTGQIMGTVDFMAPEQAANTKNADRRADIYSLGVTLWHLLTGRAMYAGETTIERLLAHREQPIPSLRSACPVAPAAVETILTRMVAKKPEDRYQSMSEVIAVLEACGLAQALPFRDSGTGPLGETVDFRGGLAAGVVGSGGAAKPSLVATRKSAHVVDETLTADGALSDTDPKTEDSLTRPLAASRPRSKSTARPRDRLLRLSIVAACAVPCGLALCMVLVLILRPWDVGGQPRREMSFGGTSSAPHTDTDSSGWHGWPADAPKPAIAPFDAAQARKHQEEWADYLDVPVEYENSIEMKFVLLPPGEFMMGSAPEEINAALAQAGFNDLKERVRSEAPQHNVILTQPIYLGAHEVTQSQYEQVMGKNPSHFAAAGPGSKVVADLDTANHPVELVSWYDAVDFCSKLSERESLKPYHLRTGESVTTLAGTGYRLPTEAEWEFACRGGTTTRYWSGETSRHLASAGWSPSNSGGRTHSVGELRANPFGLHDIHGNVWEHVQDGWEPTYYQQFRELTAINPGGSASPGLKRVVRGGNPSRPDFRCRSSSRGVVETSERSNFMGFRVALDASAVKRAIGGRKPKRELAGGYALAFGEGDRLKLPELKIPGGGPWTVEGWVTPRDPLPKEGGSSSLVFVIDHAAVVMRHHGAKGIKWSAGGPSTKPPPSVDSAENVQVDKAVHLAMSRGPEGVSFFVNGVLQGQPLQIHVSSGETTLYICLPDSNWHKVPFHGDIDEIRVSSVQRYRENFSPKARFDPDADTIALYHFDEGEGEVARDSSEHHHDGTIVGASWVRVDDSSAAAWHSWPADAPKPAIAPFDAAQAKKHQEEWADYLKVPVVHENSIGMKFVLIPPGEFMMGSTAEEIEAALVVAGTDEYWKQHIRSEAPQHKVILTQPVYLGIQKVTQAQYQKLMGQNPSHFAATGARKDAVVGLDTSNHPVEMVTWNDAAEFCSKLSEKEQLKPFYFRSGESVTMLEGTGYRLPTEAEWEFACRAGTTTKFWTGDQEEELVLAAWIGSNSGGRTHTVGELRANPLGLYDVHGNVWEWVQDWWEPTYYGKFPEEPARNPLGSASTGSWHVLRGGDWVNPASRCRASHRHALTPTHISYDIGFRVALPVDAVQKGPPSTPPVEDSPAAAQE